jgi:XTP/dITP diphosphohydrolase
LVLASANPGKLREFRALAEPLGISIEPQSAFNVSEADEPHVTFVENALAKARHASRITGLAAFADDSGLCVEALGGAPGVRSARYAPGHAARDIQDERNNEKLITALAGKACRRAHYTAVIVLVRDAHDPEPLIAEGRWHGEIIDTPRGSGGFGYDPYFHLPELARTAAELAPEHKNRISHRGLAMARLAALLRQCET